MGGANPLYTRRPHGFGVNVEVPFNDLCRSYHDLSSAAEQTRAERYITNQIHRALLDYGRRMVGLVADTLGDLAEDENSVFHMEADHEFLKWLQQHKHREESNDRARRTLDGTYNDEDYAVLRAISSETGVSGRKFGILFAGFFFFFTHKLPQKKQLISRKKLAAHCRRLEVFDAAQIRKEVLALDESVSSYNLGYMSDATDNKGERIVTYFTYPVADMSGPKAVFTGIGHVFDKTFGRCTDCRSFDSHTRFFGR
jgi:hypothetical protein